MSHPALEQITVASGAFIGWAPQPGQKIKGYVTDYDATGGTDFNGGVVPQFGVELTEPAYSVNKDGERFDFTAGEQVAITAGQANLKRTINGGRLAVGDYIELEYASTEKGSKGTVKIFSLGVARGARPVAGGTVSEIAAPAASAPATTGGLTAEQTAQVKTLRAASLTDEVIATTLGVSAEQVAAVPA